MSETVNVSIINGVTDTVLVTVVPKGEVLLSGGTTGQVLSKKSGSELDFEWVNPAEGGTGTGDTTDISGLLVKSSNLSDLTNPATARGNLSAEEIGVAATLVNAVKGGSPETLASLKILADSKVAGVSGKGLSTEDFTTTEKTKLSGIAIGATTDAVVIALKGGNTTDTITTLRNDVNLKATITDLNTLSARVLVLEETVVLPDLEAPTGLTATPNTQTLITVSWDADSTDGATANYVIKRGLLANHSDEVQIYSGTALSFQDTGRTPSTLYYYSIYKTAVGYYNSSKIYTNATSLAPPDVAQILGDGDSITAGTIVGVANSWLSKMAISLGGVSYGDYSNFAVSGATAFQVSGSSNYITNPARVSAVLSRKDSTNYNQTIDLIWIGVNDLDTVNTIQQIVGAMFSRVLQSRNSGLKPILITPTADRRKNVSDPTQDSLMQTKWAGVISECVAHGVTYGAIAVVNISTDTRIGNWAAPIANTGNDYTADKIHLNIQGEDYARTLIQPTVVTVRAMAIPAFTQPPAYVYNPSDVTAPTLLSAVVQNAAKNQIVLTFNEVLNTSTGLAASDFTVSGGKSVSSIAFNGAVLTLAVNSDYASGNVITISGGGSKIKDMAGNITTNLSGQSVTNNIAVGDITAPTILTKQTTSATNIRFVFDEPVNATSAGFSFTKNGSTLVASAISGSGTTWDLTVPTMVNGDVLAFSYSGGITADLAGNNLVATSGTVTNNITAVTLSTIRIKSGNTADEVINGYNFIHGQSYVNGGNATFGASVPAVAATAFDSAYWRFRFLSSGILKYTIPVINGDYDVILHWADCATPTSSQVARKMNIDINTVRKATNFNIYTEAGNVYNKAIQKTYPITVSGGQVILDISYVEQAAFITAIEIVPVGTATALPLS